MKRLIYEPADGEEIPDGAVFWGGYVDVIVPDDFMTLGAIYYEGFHRGGWIEETQNTLPSKPHSFAGWDLPTTPPELETKPNVQ